MGPPWALGRGRLYPLTPPDLPTTMLVVCVADLSPSSISFTNGFVIVALS